MTVFVQDESKNPYGTWKDRRSKHIVHKALGEGVTKLCLITSGNAGYSLAQFAKPHGIKVTSIVDLNLREQLKNALRGVCYKVIEVDLNKQIFKPAEVIALSREDHKETVWDVTNGYSEAYASIITDLPHKNPDYLICPVGSGEAFVGLHQGLVEHNLKTKLIGVGVLAYPSFADKLSTPWTPYENKIEEIISEGHTLIRLTEKQVRAGYEKYKNVYDAEPSAAVAWVGFEQAGVDASANVVIVNSGKGLM